MVFDKIVQLVTGGGKLLLEFLKLRHAKLQLLQLERLLPVGIFILDNISAQRPDPEKINRQVQDHGSHSGSLKKSEYLFTALPAHLRSVSPRRNFRHVSRGADQCDLLGFAPAAAAKSLALDNDVVKVAGPFQVVEKSFNRLFIFSHHSELHLRMGL